MCEHLLLQRKYQRQAREQKTSIVIEHTKKKISAKEEEVSKLKNKNDELKLHNTSHTVQIENETGKVEKLKNEI